MSRRSSRRLAAVLLLAGAAGCTGTEADTENASARALPASLSPQRGCDIPATLPPGGILAVDTSMTPRSKAAAETLAMEAGGELVAPEALYQRVVAELRAITGGDGGSTTTIGCGVTRELLVGMTEAGIAQVEAGEYTAWNDYNAHLRAVRERKAYGYKLTFDGLYNHAALAAAYAALPEVRWAEENGYVGKSGDVCLERFGDASDTHVYIFWSGGGDCPSGCTVNTYHGYAAGQGGSIEYLGRYDSGSPAPDWFSKAQQCRNFL